MRSIGDAVGLWLYVIAGGLAFAEAAILVGMVLPGETALLVAAANAGLSSGADWVSLGVWADNEPALRIYRRLGWRTDARMRSYRPAEHPATRTPR